MCTVHRCRCCIEACSACSQASLGQCLLLCSSAGQYGKGPMLQAAPWLWQLEEEGTKVTCRTRHITQQKRPSMVHIPLQRHDACPAAAARASASPSRCAPRRLPSHMLIAACMPSAIIIPTILLLVLPLLLSLLLLLLFLLLLSLSLSLYLLLLLHAFSAKQG